MTADLRSSFDKIRGMRKFMHNNYLFAIEALVRNASALTTDAEAVAREAEDVTAQHLLAISKQLNEVSNIVRQRLVAVERVKEVAA
jgi:hypothetical protein